MTHSFLLAFCHLHIILHFFSRSLLLSFHPFFPSHLILLLFFLSLFLSLFSQLPFVSFTRLAYTYFLAYSFSFPFVLSATLDDGKNFILETDQNKSFGNICFLLGGERRKKCNFNPRLFQFQFSFHAFCTCTLQFVLIIPAFDI